MRFFTHPPSPAVQRFVRDYLVADFCFDAGEPAPRKCYAPKPEQGITFFVRGRPGLVDERTGAVHLAPPVTVFGQQVRRCDVSLGPRFLMLRVHFQPGALFRVLNVPLRELGDHYFDAALLLGREILDVAERLDAAPDYAGMIAAVETYLLRLIRRSTRPPEPVDRVASLLATSALNESIDEFARQACLSPRQFNRKFTERIGAGPKIYQRLSRFYRTCEYKKTHPHASWPALALRFGYTDYQHLVRDARAFADMTPNAWLQHDLNSPENIARAPDASRTGR